MDDGDLDDAGALHVRNIDQERGDVSPAASSAHPHKRSLAGDARRDAAYQVLAVPSLSVVVVVAAAVPSLSAAAVVPVATLSGAQGRGHGCPP